MVQRVTALFKQFICSEEFPDVSSNNTVTGNGLPDHLVLCDRWI